MTSSIDDRAAGVSSGFTTPSIAQSDIPDAANEAAVLTWIRSALEEGEAFIKQDPSYPKMDKNQEYVMGNQLRGRRPSYVPEIIVNRTKKAIRTHVSTLTDIRPMFAYKTENPHFKAHSELLNTLAVVWWINNFADLDLADAIRYALTLGYSYLVTEWDASHGTQGDIRLFAKDPRDVLPIRPTRSRSVQDWYGLIIKDATTLNALRTTYPDKAHLLTSSKHIVSKFNPVKTIFRRMAGAVISPVTTLSGLGHQGFGGQRKVRTDDITLYRTYFRDPTVNASGEDISMGTPGTAWHYTVRPGRPLYPRGRLVVATEYVRLYDGPNPYWHGMFPAVKLTLDPWPWLFGGLSLVHDLDPMQEAINRVYNDMLAVLTQAAERGAVFDKNAVSESVIKRFDPRKPGFKLKLNPVAGDGFKMVDPPVLPPWTMNLLTKLTEEFDNLAGTANLQALLQLRQSPSADTIQKYWESMTPEIRLEGRLLESALREVAEMVKVNFFQFYTKKRRLMLLGDAGVTVEDLDYDPGNLVPAMAPGDEGYVPELDKNRPRDQRAQFFHQLFTFYVAPNSMLAMNAMDRKMLFVQLSRQGYMDFWTLMEMLEIPKVGQPPMMPLPAMDGSMKTVVDPETLMPTQVPNTEMRVPTTITERLIAQAQLGIGMTQNPAGRKASGQAPPKLETKPDATGAPRTTVTESRGGR